MTNQTNLKEYLDTTKPHPTAPEQLQALLAQTKEQLDAIPKADLRYPYTTEYDNRRRSALLQERAEIARQLNAYPQR